MMTKEEYKHELIRMLDSVRTKGKGLNNCNYVNCEECPLHGFKYGCSNALSSLEIYCAVEKWAKEHPQKKFKISKIEYDILQEVYSIHGNFRMYQNELINNLRKKGYFKGSYEDTEIDDYLESCEVA